MAWGVAGLAISATTSVGISRRSPATGTPLPGRRPPGWGSGTMARAPPFCAMPAPSWLIWPRKSGLGPPIRDEGFGVLPVRAILRNVRQVFGAPPHVIGILAPHVVAGAVIALCGSAVIVVALRPGLGAHRRERHHQQKQHKQGQDSGRTHSRCLPDSKISTLAGGAEAVPPQSGRQPRRVTGLSLSARPAFTDARHAFPSWSGRSRWW